jgi:AcrR family transcriptional regulator
MSREKDEKNTLEFKKRILDAAEKLFADKGFDATGITEIANTADATKSLIYYYFKNKEAILKGIFDRFIQNSLQIAEPILKEIKSANQAELLQKLLDITLPSFQTNRNVLKITLVEELKKPAEGPLFEYFKGYIAMSFKYFDKPGRTVQGNSVTIRRASLASEGSALPEFSSFIFFMVFFPILGYAALGDDWCKQMKVKSAKFSKTFSRWMTESLDRYITDMGHRNLKPSAD